MENQYSCIALLVFMNLNKNKFYNNIVKYIK